jgi:hypothetical protein
MNESYITTGPSGMAFIGPDAIRLHRAVYLANAIVLHAKCGMIPTRGMTITQDVQDRDLNHRQDVQDAAST